MMSQGRNVSNPDYTPEEIERINNIPIPLNLTPVEEIRPIANRSRVARSWNPDSTWRDMSRYGYIGLSTGKYHLTGSYKNFIPGTCRKIEPIAVKFEGVTYISRFRGTVKVTANEWVDLRIDDVLLVPMQGTIISKPELTRLSKIKTCSICNDGSFLTSFEVFGCQIFPTGSHWFRTAYFNTYCYVDFDYTIPSHYGTPYIPDNVGVFFLTKDKVRCEIGKPGANPPGQEGLLGEMDLVFDDIYCVACVGNEKRQESCKVATSDPVSLNGVEYQVNNKSDESNSDAINVAFDKVIDKLSTTSLEAPYACSSPTFNFVPKTEMNVKKCQSSSSDGLKKNEPGESKGISVPGSDSSTSDGGSNKPG